MKSQASKPDILTWRSICKIDSNVPDWLSSLLEQSENKCWTPIVNKIIQNFYNKTKSIEKNPYKYFFLNVSFIDAKEYVKNRQMPISIETNTLNIISAIHKNSLIQYKVK